MQKSEHWWLAKIATHPPRRTRLDTAGGRGPVTINSSSCQSKRGVASGTWSIATTWSIWQFSLESSLCSSLLPQLPRLPLQRRNISRKYCWNIARVITNWNTLEKSVDYIYFGRFWKEWILGGVWLTGHSTKASKSAVAATPWLAELSVTAALVDHAHRRVGQSECGSYEGYSGLLSPRHGRVAAVRATHGRHMIFDEVPSARDPERAAGLRHSMMAAYNPFLLQRQSDYSMSSILAAHPHYLPTMLPPHAVPGSILPKLQQTVARSPLTPADVLLHQGLARPLRSLEPPEAEVHDDPKVELESKELWEQFHGFGTEMVITKSGRWAILSEM